MSRFIRSAAAVALLAGVGAAHAAPVFTANGDPFPSTSTVTMTPSGGNPVSTPFGFFDTITLADFSVTSTDIIAGGSANDRGDAGTADILYTYSATFSADFFDAGGNATGSFLGTTNSFEAVVVDRGSVFTTGTFDALILGATFVGDVVDTGGNVAFSGFQTSVDENASNAGTATFTGPVLENGALGLLADTSFAVNGQFSTDGGATQNPVPLDANSTPPAAPATVPVPASLPLLGLGLIGIAALRRRAA